VIGIRALRLVRPAPGGRPADQPSTPDEPLWRGVNLFRTFSLVYALAVGAHHTGDYSRPALAWAGLAVMSGWTAACWLVDRRPTLIAADLAFCCGLAALTLAVSEPARLAAGQPTLPTLWAASAVISWAVWRGPTAGVAAALSVSAVDVVVTGRFGGDTLRNNVMMFLLGGIVGYCARTFRSSHAALRQALAVEAATTERERLARDIHDSVLQVLAFVQRRAREIGGPTEELGRLAGEQEHRLRSLVSTRPQLVRPADRRQRDLVDLRALLAPADRNRTTLVAPADPVRLPREEAVLLADAVLAALDNVERHAGGGARAWVLLDDEGDHVGVTVRDDGVGFSPSRLAEAKLAGRLGVALSVQGRVAELGGTSDIRSAPGEGTEVVLRIPRKVVA
jgi:signal transduction histidine kinase